MVLHTAIATALFAVSFGFASETDNITLRPTDPAAYQDRSALEAINEKTNELLTQALGDTSDCSLKKLHFAVKNRLAGGEVGRLERWAIENTAIRNVTVPYDQSIYAGAGLATGSPGLFTLGIVPSFVLGGHYVGADKLGHFFDQGYDYYEEVFVKHGDVTHAIESLGMTDEDGVNGMAGNGIHSYGDMAANFGGYLFWREVASGPNPYFKCEDGKFVRTSRKFDWSEYANDAWDEGLNCSEYNASVGKVVAKALRKLKKDCPVDPAGCQRIASLRCGFTFISPLCLPYVKFPSYPDAACMKLIHADEQAAQACTYSNGIMRDPTVKTATDLIDGAETVVEIRSDQAAAWAARSRKQLVKRAAKILERLNP